MAILYRRFSPFLSSPRRLVRKARRISREILSIVPFQPQRRVSWRSLDPDRCLESYFLTMEITCGGGCPSLSPNSSRSHYVLIPLRHCCGSFVKAASASVCLQLRPSFPLRPAGPHRHHSNLRTCKHGRPRKGPSERQRAFGADVQGARL